MDNTFGDPPLKDEFGQIYTNSYTLKMTIPYSNPDDKQIDYKYAEDKILHDLMNYLDSTYR